MRISDWSSDVCSSDLVDGLIEARGNQIVVARIPDVAMAALIIGTPLSAIEKASFERHQEPVLAPMVAGFAGVAAGGVEDRKSVGEGKRGSVRLVFGGPRTSKKIKQKTDTKTEST